MNVLHGWVLESPDGALLYEPGSGGEPLVRATREDAEAALIGIKLSETSVVMQLTDFRAVLFSETLLVIYWANEVRKAKAWEQA